MNFPLMGLIRLTAMAGLGLCVVAVGLGKMNPATGITRTAAPVERVGVGGYLHGDTQSGAARLLDLASGRLERLDLPGDEQVDHLSCSPWRDGRGRVQLVGRRVGYGAGLAAQEFGLIRLSYPDGVELDRIPTDLLPTSPPCWYPGTRPRILYSACDAALYHFAFNDADGTVGDNAPRPLTWRNPAANLADALILDPTWPTEPALGGRVLVSLNRRGENNHGHYDGSKLWWLQLNAPGTEIVASGRLTRPAPVQGPDSEVEERLPAVGRVGPDGPLMLTYLARGQGEEHWRLRIAPLQIDEQTGLPSLDQDRGRILAEGCDTLIPTISRDGRWVACLRWQSYGPPAFERVPLTAPPSQPAG